MVLKMYYIFFIHYYTNDVEHFYSLNKVCKTNYIKRHNMKNKICWAMGLLRNIINILFILIKCITSKMYNSNVMKQHFIHNSGLIDYCVILIFPLLVFFCFCSHICCTHTGICNHEYIIIFCYDIFYILIIIIVNFVDIKCLK